MFGLMSVKKHEDEVQWRDDRIAEQNKRILTMSVELLALRAFKDKTTAPLIAANAKRKADALAKKA